MSDGPPRPRFQRLLHDSLLDAAYECPEKEAVITEKDRTTYAHLLQQVQRCASAFTARGLERGDRVVIYLDNTLECVVALWATLWAGGVFVIVNPQTKSDKLRYLVDKSQAKLLVSDAHLGSEFSSILAKCASLNAVLCSNFEAKPGAEST